MRNNILLVAILSIGLLTSCATKVSSIKDDIDNKLDKEEGYLLLAVDTNRPLREILISGTKLIKLTSDDLQKGSNYILINLPAGDYTIDEVKINFNAHIRGFEDELWQFSVEKDKISYVGHLNATTYTYWYYAGGRFELLNKSSVALEYMEENFPQILAGRDMVYHGVGEDSFFELVAETQRMEQEQPQTPFIAESADKGTVNAK
ncbi:hypothetical protein [Thalassotalea sp. Y01]|uniref:hypothetical protein n=1 Tax=Thalassotalea sp. Y01 TaxID=2729613 RepID=UPI00145F15D4|nr:hypothetical protein [Thalassotalea sp. Y01]NMP16028.1 hypothetical protein [Thalassotalea sp. Y01]